jgi:hypothetical protein
MVQRCPEVPATICKTVDKNRVILKRLLPKTLPLARSIAPNRMADRLAEISGRGVVNARKRFPTKLRERPVDAARHSHPSAPVLPCK